MDSGEEGDRMSVSVFLSRISRHPGVSVSTFVLSSRVFLLTFLTFRCWNAALRKFLF